MMASNQNGHEFEARVGHQLCRADHVILVYISSFRNAAVRRDKIAAAQVAVVVVVIVSPPPRRPPLPPPPRGKDQLDPVNRGTAPQASL